MKKTTAAPRSPEDQLAYFFYRNGCLRVPDESRRKEGAGQYKKGYEIRLVAFTQAELKQIRGLLKQTHLQAGKPYAKGARFVQPIYGKESVEHFCETLARAKTSGYDTEDAAVLNGKLSKNYRLIDFLDAHPDEEKTSPLKKAETKLRQKASR